MPFAQINTGIRDLLNDSEQRQEFFKAMTQDDIAEQIRDLRKKRGLTQVAFARVAEMKQSAVSRIEQAEYSKWTLTTLFRVASALDARWRMILEPCEEAVKEFDAIDEQAKASLPAVTQTQAAMAPDPLRVFTINAPPQYLMAPPGQQLFAGTLALGHQPDDGDLVEENRKLRALLVDAGLDEATPRQGINFPLIVGFAQQPVGAF